MFFTYLILQKRKPDITKKLNKETDNVINKIQVSEENTSSISEPVTPVIVDNIEVCVDAYTEDIDYSITTLFDIYETDSYIENTSNSTSDPVTPVIVDNIEVCVDTYTEDAISSLSTLLDEESNNCETDSCIKSALNSINEPITPVIVDNIEVCVDAYTEDIDCSTSALFDENEENKNDQIKINTSTTKAELKISIFNKNIENFRKELQNQSLKFNTRNASNYIYSSNEIYSIISDFKDDNIKSDTYEILQIKRKILMDKVCSPPIGLKIYEKAVEKIINNKKSLSLVSDSIYTHMDKKYMNYIAIHQMEEMMHKNYYCTNNVIQKIDCKNLRVQGRNMNNDILKKYIIHVKQADNDLKILHILKKLKKETFVAEEIVKCILITFYPSKKNLIYNNKKKKRRDILHKE